MKDNGIHEMSTETKNTDEGNSIVQYHKDYDNFFTNADDNINRFLIKDKN